MKKLFAFVLKFKTTFPKSLRKRNEPELHQQIGISEQFLRIAKIEVARKKMMKMP